MKKLSMLVIVCALSLSIGYAQDRTNDNVDWNKIMEDISISVTQDMESLYIDLSDMNEQLSALPSMQYDFQYLEHEVGSEIEEVQVPPRAERAKANEARAKANEERAKANEARAKANETRLRAYVYNNKPRKEESTLDIFENISDIKGVEVVYITKALLGMMPNMDMPGVNIGKIAGKLESLQIYSTEQKNPALMLKQAMNKVVRIGNYETLMLVKDNEDDSKTALYMKTQGKDKPMELLMVIEEGSEINIIRMLGNFSLQDIKNLTKGQSIYK